MEAVDRDLPREAGKERLSEWFVLHGPALRAFFAKKAGGANAADLVQEVFICLQTRAVADNVENVERYLFKVAHNVLASHRRGLRRRDRVLAAPSGDFDVAGEITDERSPERIVQAKLDLARLGAAIRAMPPRTQAAFLMHRFDEMTYSTIALRMGISESAVRHLMSRALAQIADAMREAP